MFSILARQFEQSIRSLEGSIVEDHRENGYVCAVFNQQCAEIRRGDTIAGGIALRQGELKPELRSFSLRLACTNGMVRPKVLEQQETSLESLSEDVESMLTRLPQQTTDQIELFRNSLKVTLTSAQFRLAVSKVSHILKLSHRQFRSFVHKDRIRTITRNRLRDLMQRERNRQFPDSDIRTENTLFDLVNAVTDLAHETTSPATKWQLMRLGGQMLESGEWLSEPERAEQIHVVHEMAMPGNL